MHGIILHEEYRGWMRKLSAEDLGKIIENMFRVDEGETPEIFGDNYLDFFSETVCGRMVRDAEKSDKQRANRLGKTKNNQTITKNNQKKTKNNQKKTKSEPKRTPITNNLLPITNTNNQLPITNTNNQLKENKKESDPFVEDVISYLNYKTGRHYRVTDKTRGLINGRVKEGYTSADFKKVIDKKVKEWMGTDYEKYIQPTTLFAPSHFDNYLNQPEKQTEEDMFSAFLKGGSYGEDVEGRVYSDSQNHESGVC